MVFRIMLQIIYFQMKIFPFLILGWLTCISAQLPSGAQLDPSAFQPNTDPPPSLGASQESSPAFNASHVTGASQEEGLDGDILLEQGAQMGVPEEGILDSRPSPNIGRGIVSVQKEGLRSVSYIIHPDNLPPPDFKPMEKINSSQITSSWKAEEFIKICCSSEDTSEETLTTPSNSHASPSSPPPNVHESPANLDPNVTAQLEALALSMIDSSASPSSEKDQTPKESLEVDKLPTTPLAPRRETDEQGLEDRTPTSLLDDSHDLIRQITRLLIESNTTANNETLTLDSILQAEFNSSLNDTQFSLPENSTLSSNTNHTPRYEEKTQSAFDEVKNFLGDLANSAGFQNAFLGDLIKNFGKLDPNALKLIYSLLIQPLTAMEKEESRASDHEERESLFQPEPLSRFTPSSLLNVDSRTSDPWTPYSRSPKSPNLFRMKEPIEVITAPSMQDFEVVLGSSFYPENQRHQRPSKRLPVAQNRMGLSDIPPHPPLPHSPPKDFRLGLEMPPPEALAALPEGSVLIPPSQVLRKPTIPKLPALPSSPPQASLKMRPNFSFFGSPEHQPRTPAPKSGLLAIPSFLSSLFGGKPERPQKRPRYGPLSYDTQRQSMSLLPPPLRPPPPIFKTSSHGHHNREPGQYLNYQNYYPSHAALTYEQVTNARLTYVDNEDGYNNHSLFSHTDSTPAESKVQNEYGQRYADDNNESFAHATNISPTNRNDKLINPFSKNSYYDNEDQLTNYNNENGDPTKYNYYNEDPKNNNNNGDSNNDNNNDDHDDPTKYNNSNGDPTKYNYDNRNPINKDNNKENNNNEFPMRYNNDNGAPINSYGMKILSNHPNNSQSRPSNRYDNSPTSLTTYVSHDASAVPNEQNRDYEHQYSHSLDGSLYSHDAIPTNSDPLLKMNKSMKVGTLVTGYNNPNSYMHQRDSINSDTPVVTDEFLDHGFPPNVREGVEPTSDRDAIMNTNQYVNPELPFDRIIYLSPNENLNFDGGESANMNPSVHGERPNNINYENMPIETSYEDVPPSKEGIDKYGEQIYDGDFIIPANMNSYSALHEGYLYPFHEEENAQDYADPNSGAGHETTAQEPALSDERAPHTFGNSDGDKQFPHFYDSLDYDAGAFEDYAVDRIDPHSHEYVDDDDSGDLYPVDYADIDQPLPSWGTNESSETENDASDAGSNMPGLQSEYLNNEPDIILSSNIGPVDVPEGRIIPKEDFEKALREQKYRNKFMRPRPGGKGLETMLRKEEASSVVGMNDATRTPPSNEDDAAALPDLTVASFPSLANEHDASIAHLWNNIKLIPLSEKGKPQEPPSRTAMDPIPSPDQGFPSLNFTDFRDEILEAENEKSAMAYVLIGACVGLAFLSIVGVLVIIRFKKTCDSQQIGGRSYLGKRSSLRELSHVEDDEDKSGHKLGSWFTGRNEQLGTGKLRSNMTLPDVKDKAKTGSTRDLLSISTPSSQNSTPRQSQRSITSSVCKNSGADAPAPGVEEVLSVHRSASWLHEEFASSGKAEPGNHGEETSFNQSRSMRSMHGEDLPSSSYHFCGGRPKEYRAKKKPYLTSYDSEELDRATTRTSRYHTDSEMEDTNYEMSDSREVEDIEDLRRSRRRGMRSLDSEELGEELSRDLKVFQYGDKFSKDTSSTPLGGGYARSAASFSRDNVQSEVFLEFDNILRQHTAGDASLAPADASFSRSRPNSLDSIDKETPPELPPRPPKPSRLSPVAKNPPKTSRARAKTPPPCSEAQTGSSSTEEEEEEDRLI